MNANIENTVKQCATCPEYKQMKPQERMLPYEIQCRPWKVFGAYISMVKNNMHLCIVDYYNKFPI